MLCMWTGVKKLIFHSRTLFEDRFSTVILYLFVYSVCIMLSSFVIVALNALLRVIVKC